MSAVNRSLRTVSRQIALPRRSFPLATGFARSAAATRSLPASTKSFSSSTARVMSASAPPPAGATVYDPEITDIADYVHNKPINSELAVSLHAYPTIGRRPFFSCGCQLGFI